MSRRARRRAPRRLGPGLTAAALLAAGALAWLGRALEPSEWIEVHATREGLVGARTATGHVIAPDDVFVALPHRSALGRWVELRYRGRLLRARVLDVGPWNVDDAYWRRRGARPAAEARRGAFRVPTNPAGIDLSDGAFRRLGLPGNDRVAWRFVRRGLVGALPALAAAAPPAAVTGGAP